MVDQNWIREEEQPISYWHHQILLVAIVIGIWYLLSWLIEERETNPNANEYDHGEEMDHTNDDEYLDQFFEPHEREQEHPNGELDHYVGEEDDGHWTAASHGKARRRRGGCAFCGNSSSTRCSRCKAARYCSVKCQINHWRSGHKYECLESEDALLHEARLNHDDQGRSKLVDKSQMVRMRRNSYEEEENIGSSAEGTTSFNSPIEVSQGSTNNVLYLEDEVAKSRKEILLLQSELVEWKNRASFAREKFQSLKRESNYKLFVLKTDKESISEAQRRGCNVIHSLHERLNHLQNAVQESNAEKRKLEEGIQNLENECAELKKLLQEQHKRAQRLTMESDKNREAAQIAMREMQAVRQELQEERQQCQQLKENFRRDVIFAESRATLAEAKFSDLCRKIRISDYKVCSICISNDKDLAFGCGHMTCRDCGLKLSKCPICREEITSHIKLFPG